MIGDTDDSDALREAQRSLSEGKAALAGYMDLVSRKVRRNG